MLGPLPVSAPHALFLWLQQHKGWAALRLTVCVVVQVILAHRRRHLEPERVAQHDRVGLLGLHRIGPLRKLHMQLTRRVERQPHILRDLCPVGRVRLPEHLRKVGGGAQVERSGRVDIAAVVTRVEFVWALRRI